MRSRCHEVTLAGVTSAGLALGLIRIYWRCNRDKELYVWMYMYIYIYIHGCIYIYMYKSNVTDRNKEGRAEVKRFNQMVAKWLNRNAFGWGTLYLTSGVLGTQCWRWHARISRRGSFNDYGAWELEYPDTLLLACQQHRLVAYFNSQTDTQKVPPHILSIQVSHCPTSFRPLPFGIKYTFLPFWGFYI